VLPDLGKEAMTTPGGGLVTSCRRAAVLLGKHEHVDREARLGLHAKPMAFLDEDGFWQPFFDLIDRIIAGGFIPETFRDALVHSTTPQAAITALEDRRVVIDL
jgi:hypothetical protein